MRCPYCREFIEESVRDIGEYFDSGYVDDLYYDEFHCNCPHCTRMFIWCENYTRIGDDCSKMDGDE